MKQNFALFIITFVFNCPIVKAEDDNRSRHRRSDDGFVKDNSWMKAEDDIRSRHKRSDDGFDKDNSWRNSTDTLVSVTVQLSFVEFHNALEDNAIPDVNLLTAPKGTTAFEFLSQAAKQNPCYQFQYKKFSFGRYITSICCVSENTTSNYYWYIYINDEPSLVGVDELKPRHGDLLRFQYQYINYNSSNPEKEVGNMSKTGLNLTKIQETTPQISVLVELSFTNHPSPNVIPAHDVKAPRNSTAFELLQRAAKFNPCYSFRYEEFPSLGRYITTICCTEQNMTSGFYWFIYINGKRSAVGVDSLKPNDADTLTFKYEQWKATHTDPITRSTDNIKKPTTTALLITTSAGNAWTLSPLMINVFIVSASVFFYDFNNLLYVLP